MNKKILFIIPFLFIVYALVNQMVLAEKDIPAKRIEQIKKEQQECLDTNYQTDYTMAQCNIEAKEKYEIEMKVALKKLKKILSEQQYELVMQSQKKWEEYIKVDNSMLENIVEPQNFDDGLIHYLESTDIQANAFCNRLEELLVIYFSANYKK